MEIIFLLLPLVVILMMAFAIKDVFTRPMENTYKIIWTLIILVFHFLGVAAYYIARTFCVHHDARAVYKERFYEEGEREKEEKKQMNRKFLNIVLIIVVIYITLLALLIGYNTIRV